MTKGLISTYLKCQILTKQLKTLIKLHTAHKKICPTDFEITNFIFAFYTENPNIKNVISQNHPTLKL